MEKSLFWKFTLLIVLTALIAGTCLLFIDLIKTKKTSIQASDFFVVKGIAEKILYQQHPHKDGHYQTIEISLKNKKGNWTYTSLEPQYNDLILNLRKCQDTEFAFKTSELLIKHKAEIWNAKVCGKTIISFQDVMNYKISQDNPTRFYIKILIFCILIIFLLWMSYFVIRYF